MYACLYAPSGNLTALALSFSPVVEETSADTVIFSIDRLERLIGTPHQIASEIGRCGAAQGIQGSLAIADDPDTAAIVARNRPGVTVIAPGKSAEALAGLPIDALDADPDMLDTFESWGVRTLAELGALPETGIAARFGDVGIRLQRLALGLEKRALRALDSPLTFMQRVELEDPIGLLEPLLFVLSSILHDLTESMRRQALAADRIELALELDNKTEHRRILEFASPCAYPEGAAETAPTRSRSSPGCGGDRCATPRIASHAAAKAAAWAFSSGIPRAAETANHHSEAQRFGGGGERWVSSAAGHIPAGCVCHSSVPPRASRAAKSLLAQHASGVPCFPAGA